MLDSICFIFFNHIFIKSSVYNEYTHRYMRDRAIHICVTTFRCNFGVYFSLFVLPFIFAFVIIIAFFALFYQHFTVCFSIAVDAAFTSKWHIPIMYVRTYTFYYVFVVCILISTKLKVQPFSFRLFS